MVCNVSSKIHLVIGRQQLQLARFFVIKIMRKGTSSDIEVQQKVSKVHSDNVKSIHSNGAGDC